VIRDGNPPYEHTGLDFGINIHKGGYQGTSSEGCQTIHPDQWPGFYALAKDLAQRYHGAQWNAVVIPYALIDESVSPVPVPMTGEPTDNVTSIA
jgi:lysozyme